MKLLIPFALSLLCVACTTFEDDKMIVADGLITVELRENDLPKVDLATGFDECKWNGNYNLQNSNYRVGVWCEFEY